MKVKKEFKWEMAHKLYESYTLKCRNVHGHSYRAIFKVSCAEKFNDASQVVVDFTKLKEIVQPVIDLLDHSCLYYINDPVASEHLKYFNKSFSTPFEPTAEFLAIALFYYIRDRLGDEIQLQSVEVFETATSSAVCTRKSVLNRSDEYKKWLEDLIGLNV